MNGDTEMIGASDNLTLAELMQDPLIHMMMRSDGIDHGSIEALFARIAQSRGRAMWPKSRHPQT
jgi:hypothetical protein